MICITEVCRYDEQLFYFDENTILQYYFGTLDTVVKNKYEKTATKLLLLFYLGHRKNREKSVINDVFLLLQH